MKDSKTNMLGQIKLNMKITMMQEKMEMKLWLDRQGWRLLLQTWTMYEDKR
jgi:hypothetical protein